MQADREPPRLGGVRLGPSLVIALWVLLVLSAALALWVRNNAGVVPSAVADLAPWVFLGFAVVFGFYRLGLVRAGKYPAFKAFFQVGLALLFFMLLLPGARFPFRPGASDVDRSMAELLSDTNPTVRSLAAELAGFREDGIRNAPLLARALADPSPRVRREAHRSLVRLTGEDLGSPDDPEALKSWRERYP